MKNIQIIDGATNCTFSLFAASEAEFRDLFPGDTDVGFPDEIRLRLGEARASLVLSALWKRPIDKRKAKGIHGTLFYGLDYRKALYPKRTERSMDPRSFSSAQRKMLGIG